MPPAETRGSDSPRSPLVDRGPWPDGRLAADDGANPTCPICGTPIPLGQGVLRDDDARLHIECFDGVTRWEPSTDK